MSIPQTVKLCFKNDFDGFISSDDCIVYAHSESEIDNQVLTHESLQAKPASDQHAEPEILRQTEIQRNV